MGRRKDEHSDDAVTGLDLRAARVRRGLRAEDLARALSLSPTRVREYERYARPSKEFVERYFKALVSAQRETGLAVSAPR